MQVFSFVFRNVDDSAGVIYAADAADAVRLMAEAIKHHDIQSNDGQPPEFDFVDEHAGRGLVVVAEPGNTYVYLEGTQS